MPLFFFNIASDGAYLTDDEGLHFSSLDEAYLEACRAALDMSFDMLRTRRDPNGHRFEIVDSSGVVVMDVPFSEVLRPKQSIHRPIDMDQLHQAVQAGLTRNRGLRSDLALQIGMAQNNVSEARDLLARSRGIAS